jgi:hypothetical protein
MAHAMPWWHDALLKHGSPGWVFPFNVADCTIVQPLGGESQFPRMSSLCARVAALLANCLVAWMIKNSPAVWTLQHFGSPT